MKRMVHELSNHHLFEENPIMTTKFLSRFVWEVSLREVFGENTLDALPSFLKGFSKIQYEVGAKMVAFEEDCSSS